MFGEDDDFFGDFDPNEQRFEDNFVDFERVGLGVDHPLLMNTKLGGMKDKNNLAKMQERFLRYMHQMMKNLRIYWRLFIIIIQIYCRQNWVEKI